MSSNTGGFGEFAALELVPVIVYPRNRCLLWSHTHTRMESSSLWLRTLTTEEKKISMKHLRLGNLVCHRAFVSPEMASERSRPWRDGRILWTAVRGRQPRYWILNTEKQQSPQQPQQNCFLMAKHWPEAAGDHPPGCSVTGCKSEKENKINIKIEQKERWYFRGNNPMKWFTCTELVMVLRAKIVAQSFTVDWLSKAPWVSINTTATYRTTEGSTGRAAEPEPNSPNVGQSLHVWDNAWFDDAQSITIKT